MMKNGSKEMTMNLLGENNHARTPQPCLCDSADALRTGSGRGRRWGAGRGPRPEPGPGCWRWHTRRAATPSSCTSACSTSSVSSSCTLTSHPGAATLGEEGNPPQSNEDIGDNADGLDGGRSLGEIFLLSKVTSWTGKGVHCIWGGRYVTKHQGDTGAEVQPPHQQ